MGQLSGVTSLLSDLFKLKPRAVLNGCDLGVPGADDPDIYGNSKIPNRFDANGQRQCEQARSLICAAIRRGFNYAGFRPNGPDNFDQDVLSGCNPVPSPNLDEQRLQAMFGAINAHDAGGGFLAHWTCRSPCKPQDDLLTYPGQKSAAYGSYFTLPTGVLDRVKQALATGAWPAPLYDRCSGTDLSGAPAGYPPLGECQFIIPVRRLIVNPDSIQLVIYDNENDWSSAGLAAKYAILGAQFVAGQANLSDLCNYSRPDNPFARPFRLFQIARGVLGCSDGVATGGALTGSLADQTQPNLNLTNAPTPAHFPSR